MIGFARGLAMAAIAFALHAPAAAETIVVGVEDIDYSPHYAFVDGRYSGYGAAVLDRFAAAHGLAFAYEPLPVARLFRALFTGAIGLKYPDDPQWLAESREGVPVAYSAPLAPYVDGVMTPPALLGRPIASVAALGIVTGFIAPGWDERERAGLVSYANNGSLDRLVRQALLGRIDAVYGNVDVIRHRLRALGAENALAFDATLPHTRGAYVAASVSRPDIVAALSAWLAANAAEIAALRAAFALEEDR